MENIDADDSLAGSKSTRQRIALGFIIASVIAGIVLAILDWEKFLPVLQQADWKLIPAALLLTLVSYTCVSYAFALVSRMLGIAMRPNELAEVAFVSTILNHVLTTGGVAGYSVRYLLMHRRGVSLKDVLAASLLHFYLTSLDMLTMLPIGFLYLLLNATLPQGVTALLGLMTLFMTAVAVLATLVIFHESWRTRLGSILERLAHKLLRWDLHEQLARFDATLSRGVAAMRREPLTVLAVMALTWIDWFSSVIVVYLCFDAFGAPVKLGVILSGYVIGVMAGVLSMVPGGFGVQEGSMAGVFVLLGASFEQSILASILFRGIFFLIPYGVSLGFYGRLLRGKA